MTDELKTSDNIKQANEIFLKLTDDQRMEVLSDYCIHCGCNESNIPMGCQCWNDE